jgi:hypothetical protein
MRIESKTPVKTTRNFEIRSFNFFFQTIQALCPFNRLLCHHKCSQIDSIKLFEECIKGCETEKAFDIWNRFRM